MKKLGAINLPQGPESAYDRNLSVSLYRILRDMAEQINALIDATAITGETSITVASALEHEQTVTADGLRPGMTVLVTLAPHADADENAEQAIDLISVTGTAGTNTLTIKAAFTTVTTGIVRFNYMAT